MGALAITNYRLLFRPALVLDAETVQVCRRPPCRVLKPATPPISPQRTDPLHVDHPLSTPLTAVLQLEGGLAGTGECLAYC